MSGERRISAVAGVLSAADACWNGYNKQPVDRYAHMAEALHSARLVTSPEREADVDALVKSLWARIVELEARDAEAPIAAGLTELAAGAQRSADRLTALLAPTQALREDDDPGRCLKVHAFSPRDGWRMICGSCDHGKDAACHRVESGGLS